MGEYEIRPAAVQSVAATRVLKELVSGEREQQQQAAFLLEKFMGTVAGFFGEGTRGDKLLKEMPEHEGIGLCTALTVLSTYFQYQGDWSAMLKDLEKLCAEAHQKSPPAMIDALVNRAAGKLKKSVAYHYAHKDDPVPPAPHMDPGVQKALEALQSALKAAGASEVEVKVEAREKSDAQPEAPATATEAPQADDKAAA